MVLSGWQGSLVRVRAIELSDVDDFVANDLDVDGARGSSRVYPPRSSWAAAEWIRQEVERSNDGDEFRVAIESLATGQLVGTLNTHRCDPTHGTCSYGIGIFEWARRQGFGRDAVVLVLQYLFGERRYQKCTVGVYGFNLASVEFHQAFGFTVEGRIRRAHVAMGALHDEVILGITVEEFIAKWGS